jgi:hydroxymethylpyrimidine kinase/phosphomethylpyrimidine kinase
MRGVRRMGKPIAITIAGHDPSGGAGAVADALTFAALGCIPSAVVTAVTYQNTAGVAGFEPVAPETVEKQLIEVMDDYQVSAAKLGMLGSASIASTLASYIAAYADAGIPIVCDTVFASGGGEPLFEGGEPLFEGGGPPFEGDAVGVYAEHVIPHCSLFTPNLPDAEMLTGEPVEDPRAAVEKLYELYEVPVLLKGGHAPGENVTDTLFDSEGFAEFSRPRVDEEIHGTGCLLSAAITAYFARGYELRDAVLAAEDYVSAALEKRLKPGKGAAIPDRLAEVAS